MNRAAAALVIAAIVGLSLTGCGRFARDGDPLPAESTPASVESVVDVLTELDAVDDLLTQSEEDAAVGDEAARTDDAP